MTLSHATAQYHLARNEEELRAFGEGEGVNWQLMGRLRGGRTKGSVVCAGTWSGVERWPRTWAVLEAGTGLWLPDRRPLIWRLLQSFHCQILNGDLIGCGRGITPKRLSK